MKIDSFFYERGFVRRKSDPNLYIKRDEYGNIGLISLYVDDLIITGSALRLIEEIKIHFSHVFEMKDLGESHYCLGLEIWRESSKTIIAQRKYPKTILEIFHMIECKPVSTRLEQMPSCTVMTDLKK